MLNSCHIFSLKRKKIYAFALIVCLISGLTPTAEAISVKLGGKIALGGILSGLAYTTYVLVTRDKRATEKLQLHLGPPDRVVQFERGFDRWRIDYYGEKCYLFRNNLFIETVPCASLQSDFSNRSAFAPPSITLQSGFRYVFTVPFSRSCGDKLETFVKRSGAKHESRTFKKPFLIHTPVSGNPM